MPEEIITVHTDATNEEVASFLSLIDGVIGLAPGQGIVVVPSDGNVVFAAIKGVTDVG